MRRLLRVSVAVLLAALALVAAAGSAAAHSAKSIGNSGVAGSPTAPGPRLDAIGPIGPVLTAAPASLVPSWYLPAVLALGAATIWRRPRRVVVVMLVLVLGVFAFENALHSVHHGLDPKQQEACTIAAAAAELAAVPVDGVAPASLLLFAAAQAAEPAPTFSLIRFPSPDQGRAPPSAIL